MSEAEQLKQVEDESRRRLLLDKLVERGLTADEWSDLDSLQSQFDRPPNEARLLWLRRYDATPKRPSEA